MRFGPAVSGEVRGDAGGEEGEAGADGKEDPGELDAALEHEARRLLRRRPSSGGW
jgi:hypothetical protein